MTTTPLAQLAQALAAAAGEAALVDLGGDPAAASRAAEAVVGEALGAVLAMPEVLAVIDARVAAALT